MNKYVERKGKKDRINMQSSTEIEEEDLYTLTAR